ncbi:hypothetical protein [Gulosibacter sp. 10]|uniref:hypothetical protein n=1 Tax=Gulosibacter sp. 10 TaxID=1255570 RepID=UPI00097F018D|nr:hypothetical protein [Gulosibacter sp. 10]SJM64222.1 hypothetical protein FM112_09960 [Gulosibacter sp. 10]
MSAEPENTPRPDVSEDEYIVLEKRPGIKLTNWIWGGAAVGLLAAFGVTFFLPGQEEYSPGQVFGFFGVFFVALGALLGTAVGLIVNWWVGRGKTERVLLRRLPDAQPAGGAEGPGASDAAGRAEGSSGSDAAEEPGRR